MDEFPWGSGLVANGRVAAIRYIRQVPAAVDAGLDAGPLEGQR